MTQKISGRIIHVKTTPVGKFYRHFYWNRKRFCFVNTPKSIFPVESVFSSIEYKKSCLDLSRNEIQLGDSVIYIVPDRRNPFIFATVTGVYRRKKKVWLWLEPSKGKKSSFKAGFVRYIPKRFSLVSNNLHPRKLAPENDVEAMYQDEVDKLEALISTIAIRQLFHRFFPTHLDELFSENALRIIHAGFFGLVYKWAGSYRSEEVVVTERGHPTLDHKKIPESMRDFYEMFSKQLKSAASERKADTNLSRCSLEASLDSSF